MLQIFDGFGRDQVCDLAELTPSELQSVLRHKLVKPKRTKSGFKYSFQDLLMLRLIQSLRKQGVRIKKIEKAQQYLKHINPEHSLTNFKLYIDDETKSILYLGEKLEGFKRDNRYLTSMDKFGQLMAAGLLTILPVGKDLEGARQNVITLDRDLVRSLKAKKVVSLDSLMNQYGVQ